MKPWKFTVFIMLVLSGAAVYLEVRQHIDCLKIQCDALP